MIFDTAIAAAKGVTVLAIAVGSFFGGVTAMDARYEMKEIHGPQHDIIQTGMDTFSYTILKKEIREIRTEISRITSGRRKQELELDLQDAIDRLCLIAPTDRECK